MSLLSVTPMFAILRGIGQISEAADVDRALAINAVDQIPRTSTAGRNKRGVSGADVCILRLLKNLCLKISCNTVCC